MLSGVAHYRGAFLLSLILIRGYCECPQSLVLWWRTGDADVRESSGTSAGKEAARAANEGDAKGTGEQGPDSGYKRPHAARRE